MGTMDKVIRVSIAVIFIVLYFANIVTGTIGIILLVLAGALFFTSIVSFCSLYTILGITTCRTNNL